MQVHNDLTFPQGPQTNCNQLVGIRKVMRKWVAEILYHLLALKYSDILDRKQHEEYTSRTQLFSRGNKMWHVAVTYITFGQNYIS